MDERRGGTRGVLWVLAWMAAAGAGLLGCRSSADELNVHGQVAPISEEARLDGARLMGPEVCLFRRAMGLDCETAEDVVRLNHLQFWGTHNSYHRRPAVAFDDSHKYEHAPLKEQLADHGVRAFELDLHNGSGTTIDVYHIQVIDSRTHCDTLTKCLTQMKEWSDENPNHLPVIVWFEAKTETAAGPVLRDLSGPDRVVREVMGDRIYTPDDLKAGYASPRARVDAEGWPSLRDMRGKFLFAMLNHDELTEAYSDGFTTLDGRAIFIKATPDQYERPWAVVTKINNPQSAGEIREALDRGLIVASNTCGAGNLGACMEKRVAATMNGTTTFHDDFEAEYAPFGEGQIAGCNPITAPPECADVDLTGP